MELLEVVVFEVVVLDEEGLEPEELLEVPRPVKLEDAILDELILDEERFVLKLVDGVLEDPDRLLSVSRVVPKLPIRLGVSSEVDEP